MSTETASTISERELAAEHAAIESEFSIGQARQIVTEFFQPKAWIYWVDFLGSFAIGNICFRQVLQNKLFSFPQIAFYLASCIAFYRCVLFIHELVHLRTNSFKWFRVAWNVLCGIPFLIPSFMYYTHLDHHRRKMYGTKEDGEYIPLGQQSPWSILGYMTQPFWMPILYVFRFMILTPLAYISPWVRQKAYRHLSSMVMEPRYVRPMPTKEDMRVWRIQEIACAVWCWAIGIMLIRGAMSGMTIAEFERPIKAIFTRGELPLAFLIQIYLTSVGILMANNFRTLGAHRFLGDGSEMNFTEQLLDSVNYPRWPLVSELVMPVGLRYHALHHLFPSLPYHNLDRAHAKLMRELPADSIYRKVNEESLIGALWKLWNHAKNAVRERNREPQQA